MESDPGLGYLDGIFAALRAFAHEVEATKRWLGRAEQTDSEAWRRSFLHEARAAFERAPERLGAVLDRLAALGPVDDLPPPLDRLGHNLTALRADLDAQGERLSRAEAEALPIGRA